MVQEGVSKGEVGVSTPPVIVLGRELAGRGLVVVFPWLVALAWVSASYGQGMSREMQGGKAASIWLVGRLRVASALSQQSPWGSC